jgi:quinol monooxygenase YgiN
MLAVVVEFHIHSPHVQAFHEAIVANAGLSLATEPGCRQFDVCVDPTDPSLLFLYELYDDERAFAEHLRSSHFQHMNELTASWVSAKSVRLLQVVPRPDAADMAASADA